ncbi:MAG: hypothetical protein AB7W47_08450 [Calditrichaceae bacterium]
MTENTVDLKNLIIMINENKDIQTNLCLDEGCRFEAEDPKPLIKVINYIMNYLNQMTAQPMEISLDLRDKDYLLSFMAFTEAAELPAWSAQVDDALKSYNAQSEIVHESGKYAQVKVIFSR